MYTSRGTGRATTRRAISVVFVLAFVLSGCGNGETPPVASTTAPVDGSTQDAEDAAAGGEKTKAVVGVVIEPGSLDAHFPEQSSQGWPMNWSVTENLVRFSPEGELLPWLASEVPEIVEGDELRWRVPLREGVVFSNGEPFNAEAVKANVDRVAELGLEPKLGAISGAEVVDEHTVDLLTDVPDPILKFRLVELLIQEPSAMQEEGYGTPASPIIGTGPMMIEQWDQGERVLYTPNPQYDRDYPAQLDEIEIRFIPDASTRVSALLAGELDLAADVPVDQIDRIPQAIHSSVPPRSASNRINLDDEPYSDPNFRRAINFALNKEEMNESLLNGLQGIQACQPVVETAEGYNPNLDPYPYDPDRARELLDQVDIPEDFVLEFDWSSGLFPADREQALAFIDYWSDIGIEADVTFYGADTFAERFYQTEEINIINGNSVQNLNNAAAQIGLYIDRDNEVSMLGDLYPELDPLVETALTSFDDAERQQAFEDIWQLACDEALFLFTFDLVQTWGASADLSYEPWTGDLQFLDLNRISFDS